MLKKYLDGRQQLSASHRPDYCDTGYTLVYRACEL